MLLSPRKTILTDVRSMALILTLIQQVNPPTKGIRQALLTQVKYSGFPLISD